MNTKLIQGYSEYLKAAGRRPGTILNHENRVKKLISWIEQTGLEFSQLKVKHAQEYQGHVIACGKLTGGGYTSGTVRNYIKTAVTFFQFLKSGKLVVANPFLEVRKIHAEKKLPRNLLKEKEMNLLLDTLAEFWKTGSFRQKRIRYRMHVLAEVLYSTGMRIGEAAALDASVIDFERGTIGVCGTKNGEDRTVFLNEYAKEVLRRYLIMRDDLLGRYNRRIFGACSLALSKHITRELGAVCKELKLPDVQGHTFRHCYGFHFLRAGCSIRFIQELLGHRRLKSTEVYTKVEKEDLRGVLDKHHPRKWKHETAKL